MPGPLLIKAVGFVTLCLPHGGPGLSQKSKFRKRIILIPEKVTEMLGLLLVKSSKTKFIS